ncbi:MAG: transporter [candidate division Zixibacteria bacterium RBG_16_53_22]|nr:MAG: transporter [candidate division Zixibacteria bacterium RBG_16_53_22]
MRPYKYYDIILGLFVAVLLISNVASTKILDLGPFTFDGGTILFPISYIFGDILTEVYGYRSSRRVIWTGFFASMLMSVTFIAVGALPSARDWGNQDAYEKILGLTPRIVAASLIAYFAGEFSNSYVLAKMKIATGGRWLWSRTISSTMVGQAADTVIFCFIAFGGAIPNSLLLTVVISNYIFKVGFEAVFTPITYAVVNFLKRREGMDVFDRGTNFNPFVFGRVSSE